MTFDRASLEDAGFVGWVPFSRLQSSSVPMGGGIYVVSRVSDGEPIFLSVSPAGRHKGMDPTVTIERLAAKWVALSPVLYIGKAVSLSERLDSYRRQGIGQSAGHWGGRLLWQCAEASTALVAWRESVGDPEDDESALLDEFFEAYGALPFANLKRGRRRPR
jgi:hypothetical protein